MSGHKNTDNLRSWKPGQSGNPKGKPKGMTFRSKLRELLASTEANGKPIEGGKTVMDKLIEVAVREALKGNYQFYSAIMDRHDGNVNSYPKEGDDAADARRALLDKAKAKVEAKMGPPKETIPIDEARTAGGNAKDGEDGGDE